MRSTGSVVTVVVSLQQLVLLVLVFGTVWNPTDAFTTSSAGSESIRSPRTMHLTPSRTHSTKKFYQNRHSPPSVLGASITSSFPDFSLEDSNDDDDRKKDAPSSTSTTNKSKSASGVSVAAATLGLTKAMVGTGLLALPSGLAKATDYKSGLWLAALLFGTMGSLSAYTFILYGRLVHATQARGLGDLWSKIKGQTEITEQQQQQQQQQQQSSSNVVVSLVNFLFCWGCALSYSLVIGDTFTNLIKASGVVSVGGWMAQRQSIILAVTIGILLPLCNLSSLAALAPVSMIGTAGNLVTLLFMALRCPAVVPKSPYAIPKAGLLATVSSDLQPSFSTYSRFSSPAPLILASTAVFTFMAHFSVTDFYQGLKVTTTTDDSNKSKSIQTSNDNTTIRKFKQVTLNSFTTVFVLNILTLAFGFLTFGGNSAGIILNNYATHDKWASLSRFLVGVSIIGSYPFTFRACRSSALELYAAATAATAASKSVGVTPRLERQFTVGLLSMVTAVALVAKDAGIVISLNGSLMGTLIAYILPALLFLHHSKHSLDLSSKRVQLERIFCRFVVGFGVVSGVIGSGVTIVLKYFPHLLA